MSEILLAMPNAVRPSEAKKQEGNSEASLALPTEATTADTPESTAQVKSKSGGSDDKTGKENASGEMPADGAKQSVNGATAQPSPNSRHVSHMYIPPDLYMLWKYGCHLTKVRALPFSYKFIPS